MFSDKKNKTCNKSYFKENENKNVVYFRKN